MEKLKCYVTQIQNAVVITADEMVIREYFRNPNNVGWDEYFNRRVVRYIPNDEALAQRIDEIILLRDAEITKWCLHDESALLSPKYLHLAER